MSRVLWGEVRNQEKKKSQEKVVDVYAKKNKFKESQSLLTISKKAILKIKNPYVTQTIEVMKQMEMVQTLIDTYSTKSGTSNFLLNPSQIIPEVDFPPENVADFVTHEKFNKPIWFVPPLETPFTRGTSKQYLKIDTETCKAALKKAVCGHLRVSGFIDSAESALILFTDAIEEFVRNLLQQIQEVQGSNTQVQIQTLEKAYFLMRSESLITVHDHWRSLLARNRSEVQEFKSVYEEYDKLMKDSQNMQKEELQESNIFNILEIPSTNQDIPNVRSQEQNISNNMLLNIFECNVTK